MRILSAAISLGAFLLLPGDVRADSSAADYQEPSELQAEAVRHSGQGDHQGAIDRLERACAKEASSDCLWMLAQEQEALARKAGDVQEFDRALRTYRAGLAEETNDLRRRALSERIDALDRERLALGSALPVPAEAVKIGFRSDAKSQYVVQVGAKTCATPCSLDLVPGRYRLVTGAGSVQLNLRVGASTPGVVHLAPNAERFLVPGIVLTILGGAVASSAWLLATIPGCDDRSSACLPANVIIWPIVGGAMLFTGVGLLGYWSGHHASDAVVQPDSDPHAANQAPGLKLASIGIQPSHGGATAGVGFAF